MVSIKRASSAVLLGSVVGVAIGVAASWGRTGGWDVPTVVVFALATGIPVVGFAWEWLRRDDEPIDHPEDTIESAWLARAQSGAFLDVLIFAGCATAVSSLLDRRPPGADLVLLVAMGSAVARMVVLKRRES